jgi:lysozyme
MIDWLRRLFNSEETLNHYIASHGLKARVERHEGKRHKPYLDTVGKITIGIGRNLDDKGISSEMIDLMFKEDIADAVVDAKALFATFDDISPLRQEVLVEMCFQMGRGRVRGFEKMRKAIGNGDWALASAEMLSSKWAKTDSPNRARELSKIMKDNQTLDIIV